MRILTSDEISLLDRADEWRFVGCRERELAGRELPPDREVPEDCHHFRELMMVLSGECEVRVGEELYDAGPGAMFWFDSDVRHDRRCPYVAPDCRQLWIYFLPDAFAASLFEVRSSQYALLRRYWQKDPNLVELLMRAWSAWTEAATPLARRRLRAGMELLLVSIREQEAEAERNSQPAPDRRSDAIQAITRHLNQTLGIGDNLKSLARLSGYSRSQFLRLFRRHIGCNLREYLNRLRLRRSIELHFAGYSQKEIADRLGFASVSSYYHWRQRHQK